LHLVVRDDGIGFDVRAVQSRRAANAHLGLQGMEERALLVGGQLDITSTPGQGTEVHGWFPLSAPHPLRAVPSR
jgi:two-component system sensor histidine kinase UhpB